MLPDNRIDIGTIQIHKKVIADIAALAMGDVEGVTPIPRNAGEQILDTLGYHRQPGIDVIVDKNHQVTIDMKVCVRFGLNIPETARQVQEVVRHAVEKATDIDLREVHVNVYGVERRKG